MKYPKVHTASTNAMGFHTASEFASNKKEKSMH
jgi:hypothetical protein